MAEIKQIVINGETYSIKDAQAREDFENFLGEELILNCGTAPIEE